DYGDRSVRSRSARLARPPGDAGQRRGDRRARVPRRARARPGRSGRGTYRSRGELLQGRQARRGQEADARGARDRAHLRARADAAAQVDGRLAMRIGVLGAAAIVGCTLVPALEPPVGAELPAVSDNRYAGLQWRFVRIKYHFITEGTRFQQDFY